MPKAVLINKIAASVADNQEPPGAGLFSDFICLRRFMRDKRRGGGCHQLSSDSALTGRNNTFTPSSFLALARFDQRVPVFTVAEIDQRIFSRTQSSLAEHKSAVFSTMSPKSSSNTTMPDFESLNVMRH